MAVGLVAALVAATLATPAQAKPPWRAPWTAAVRTFRYEATQGAPGGTLVAGQRVGFKLVTDAHGGARVVVLTAEGLSAGVWKPLAFDADCLRALHAQPGELAEVRLIPLPPEAKDLGDAFMAGCAPNDLFTPMTDILNVALIVTADQFHSHDLVRVGQTVSFAGFSTSVAHGDLAVSESSDAGEVTLLALSPTEARLDWKPSVSKLELAQGAGAQRTQMSGTEHFAFRVGIERSTGLLTGAYALFDDLDLAVAVPNLPADKAPHVKLRRVVSITPLSP